MFSDFRQKKRNKFRKITNIAISKVQRIILDGFTDVEDIYFQEMHRKLLSIAKEQNKSQEVGILIDIITWEDWIILGRRDGIEKKNNMDAYYRVRTNKKNTLMFMHNHPNSSIFSGEDFKTFCNNDSLYAITVVGNDGTVQVLSKTKDFDKSSALNYYYELAMHKYIKKKNNGTYAMRELLKNANNIGLIYNRGGRSK